MLTWLIEELVFFGRKYLDGISPVFVVSPGSLIHLLAWDSRQRQEQANNCVNSDLTNGGWPIPTHHPLHSSNGARGNETRPNSHIIPALAIGSLSRCINLTNLLNVNTTRVIYICQLMLLNLWWGFSPKVEEQFYLQNQAVVLCSDCWLAKLPLTCRWIASGYNSSTADWSLGVHCWMDLIRLARFGMTISSG